MTLGQPSTFRPFTGLFEPSAIQQLPDGRFLVVEDEKRHPFSLVDIGLDGRVAARALEPAWFAADEAFWKLDDLEGLTLDRMGHVYAITSHSRDGDGGEKRARDRLVRFRIEGERVAGQAVFGALKPALLAAHPILAAAAAVLNVKAEGGFNIEALECDPDGQGLLIGLRSPLLDGRAIVVRLNNPAEVFEAGAFPCIAERLVTLDLAGNGIRGLSWVPSLAGYLVVAGPVAREAVQFQLWFWSGRLADPARRVSVPGLAGFEHAEGVCPAVIAGRERIVVVSDDGSREAGRYARFLLLEPGQLQIAG